MLKSDEKVLVSKELVQKFEEINRALDKCCDLALQQPIPNKQIALMTDASFGAAGYAVLIEDDPIQKFTSLRKSYAPVAYGSKTFTPAQIKMSIFAKEFLATYFAFKEFGHIFWGAPKPVIILTDNKAVTRFFQTKIIPPALWNACDYVIQFNFVIAHIPGAQNTAADYLSRLEADPKDKLVMKIREDVQTLPIEINVQSAGVSQEEQIFYTNDDDETEEQFWARKEAIRKNPATDEPTVTIQTLSTNLVKQHPDIQVRLKRTIQIIIEQSKDAVLQQLEAKLLHEEYSENLLHQDARYRHYGNNLERIVLKDEILTRQYYDETGNVKYHQILLPQHLLQELLQSLHETSHKHPGISKMLQEIRQRYYYPSMAKHVKNWVEGCEQCARDKRVPNATITPELLNLPEWDLGPEDAMQIRLLPNLPPSGGYENVLTAIDVFSRYLFAYPLTDASAINVAKAIIDIMTKHSYLPTTLITDKSTAFTSTIIPEVTQILGITLKCATTKHPQTIGKLERTHTSLKTNLKMAKCGEYRRQWHKYLPLAVLNHNTLYHASIGCEPTRVFHGRIPFNILDHKLGNNPNEQINPTTEFAEEIQNRTKILIDKTKQNIMQSYIKYKEYYDRKAKAAPLKENEYCFVLQPKADNQGSKIPFRDYRWVGPFVVQKVLPNEKYIVRRINTNKTQILHRIRLKKFVPNQPLEDNFREQQLQPDEEIVIPQDDLYVITWETDFGEQLVTRGNETISTSMPNGERPNAAETNTNDVTENEADYIITREVTNNDNAVHSRNDHLNDDVTERKESTAVTKNEESDWPNPAVSPKNREKSLPNTADRPENDENFSERNLTNENDTHNSPNRGDDIIVPEISENDARNESLSPRGGKYNLRPNSNPNYSEDFRY